MNAEKFRAALERNFQVAQRNSHPFVDLRSGDLYREVGGYPGRSHRMQSGGRRSRAGTSAVRRTSSPRMAPPSRSSSPQPLRS